MTSQITQILLLFLCHSTRRGTPSLIHCSPLPTLHKYTNSLVMTEQLILVPALRCVVWECIGASIQERRILQHTICIQRYKGGRHITTDKHYLIFPHDVSPYLLRTTVPDEFIQTDTIYFEITAELWDYLEANRDEIKLYELVEGQLFKMTQEEYDLKNPVQVIVTE